MVDIVKQDMTYIWATSGDVTAPDNTKISEGWAVEAVPRQWWNWMQNRADSNIAYMLQKGIPEWDATTEFLANKSYVQRSGVLYKALLTGTNQDPVSAPTYWAKAFTESSAASEALASVTPAANTVPYFTGTNTAAVTSLTAFARTILDDADASAVRTTISAQQADATLTAIAGAATGANILHYFTGTDAVATTTLTAAGRALIDDADFAAMRTTLELGNAATATVQTTGYDTTAGRLATNNFMGWGASGNVQILSAAGAFDNLTVSALYRVAAANAIAVGGPVAASGLLTHYEYGTTEKSQVFHVLSGADVGIYSRRMSGGTWSPWAQGWHSGNQLALGTTPATARTALELGTLSTQNANSVAITGGTITGITDLAIADGGTGASTATQARTNLGLGTAATRNAQTSTTDTTAAALLALGAFGLGAVAITTTDFDGITVSGFYEGVSTSGPTSSAAYTILHIERTGNGAVQYASRISANEQYVRTKSAGVWTAWTQIWHSGNQLDIGTTASDARTALGLANSATITATSSNTASNIVQRDSSGNFAANTVFAALNGNATTATSAATLTTARTIALSGEVTGTATSFNGSANISIATSITDGGWVTLTLVNSFTHTSSPLQYRKVGNIVFVHGQVDRATVPAFGTTVTTIPAGFRPSKNVGSTSIWVDSSDVSGVLYTSTIGTDGILNIGFFYPLAAGSASGAGTIGFSFSYPV